jgi:hypothetical protein
MAESKSADLPLVDTPTETFYRSKEYKVPNAFLQASLKVKSIFFEWDDWTLPEGFLIVSR